MSRAEVQARTKNDLIIEAWESLDCESVGAKELEELQRIVGERFGDGAVESPASIARTLADEGAVLRHPEVLEFDARWREKRLQDLLPPEALKFGTLKDAAESIQVLESIRRKLEQNKDLSGLRRLRETAQSIRSHCLVEARSKVIDDRKRAKARERAEWLRVWLGSPEIFLNWLDLRLLSPEFQRNFAEDD
jgi:hypothetical protein